jgi:hypothetical protein
MFTFIEEGTVNADTGWVLASPTGNADLGTDDLVFSQFSGAGSIEAGSGLTKTGSILNVGGTADRISVGADTVDIAASYVGQTSLTTLGTITTGTWTADVVGTTYGGTGLSTVGADGTVLKADGGSLVYAAVDLTADVTGILPAANGGLGIDISSFGTGSILTGTGTGVTELALGAADSFLRVNSAGTALEYTTTSIDDLSDVVITSVASNDLLQFNGTNWVNVDPSVVGGNTFSTFATDSGSAIADTTSDTVTFGGDGIYVTATDDPEVITFALTLKDLAAGAGTIALGDTLAVNAAADGATTSAVAYTFTDVVNDLNIPNNITSNGFVVRTADDAYTARTIVASTTASEQGLIVTNGAGVAANPTVGLDINGLTLNTSVANNMEIAVFDGVNNTKITVGELISDAVPNKIQEGDTSVAIVDAATGEITWTVDGTQQATLSVIAGWTFDNNVNVSGSNTFTVGTGATDLNGTLDVAGAATFQSQIDQAGGTAGTPGYSFTGDLDTGVYSDTANTVCIAGDGVDVVCFEGDSATATAGEKITFTHASGEVRMEASNTAASGPVDIRLVPQGTGQVFLGDPGTEASITTSDGTGGNAGEDLRITAGDGDSNTGGSILIGPGAGSTSGNVCIQSAPSTVGGADNTRLDVACFEGVASAVNSFTFTNAATGNGPVIAATGESNVDINFLPVGTGVLAIDSSVAAATYASNVTADNDIPNKLFVENAVANATSGGVFTLISAVDFTTASAQTVGTLPANARVLEVRLEVNTISDAVTTVTLGYTGMPAVYQADDQNDPEVEGSYESDVRNVAPLGSDTNVLATVATAGTVGAGRAIVRYVKD